MNTLFQLDIPKRSMQCAHQGERLLPGMEIYSLILEEENSERLARRDFCSACWTHVRASQGEQALARGYWKSKIEKRQVAENSSRAACAFALLRELQQAPESHEAEIFVLCLFLARARQLVLRQEFQKEGVIYHLYEIVRKEEFLTIQAVNLSQIQIEVLQKSLADQLYATRSG